MKKRIAVGVAGTICVLGLAYIPASPLESGFEAPKAKAQVVNVKEAEAAALRRLKRMEVFCKTQGKGAETWAEINSTQPRGYEVLGECAGDLGVGGS